MDLKRKRDDDDSDPDSDLDNEVWEEIEIPVPALPAASVVSASTTGDAEGTVTIQVDTALIHQPQTTLKRVRITKEMRELRTLTHQVHLLGLVVAAKARNSWANDATLQCILQSIVPQALFNLSKKSEMDRVEKLVEWWRGLIPPRDNTVIDESTMETVSTCSSLDSLIVDASNLAHSRLLLSCNTRALLFTALCRTLGLKTRLVACLYPLPISFAQAALNPKYRIFLNEEDSPEPAKPAQQKQQQEPIETDALKFWTQIHIESNNTYLNITPSAVIVPDTAFEPSTNSPDQLHLVYVLAFNQDSTFRDVSELFNTRWAGRVGKLRPSHPEDQEWWRTVVWLGSGDVKSVQDVVEDVKLKAGKEREVMPSRFADFKNNDIYALERHCTQSEIIYPTGQAYAIGKFKGEFVYPRTLVKEVLSAVNWRKRGRQVKEGQEPVKQVKARGNSINKKREIELERLNSIDSMDVDGSGVGVSEWTDLFGEWQTDACVPESLVNGKISRNRFGNFEILHKNMMPEWGARVKVPGAAQVAKKLGIDYAPVMTGFEHHRGRATPTIEGIIVLKENRDILLEACTENEAHTKTKADQQKTKRAINNWRKLVEKAVVMQDLND
ncbi:UNVERIFIED_CONTAM: hypothetical protein HDU68_012526, partial [Siphonaria sp. JEL0065]